MTRKAKGIAKDDREFGIIFFLLLLNRSALHFQLGEQSST